jgi:methyltransferase (TIGR00027 family)
MKEGKPSITAELTAAVRAAESLRPKHKRVCYDPLAKSFLGFPFSILAKNRLLVKLVLWEVERIAPGISSEVIARTRYIDDRLNACIKDGIRQLVILGAGYDTRAYRFDELKGSVKVYELDFPATQKVKMQRVKKILRALPQNVIYVPIDFEKDPLNMKLQEHGYNRNLQTLFIWEGVTYYLTPQAIDNTLAFIAENSGEGSSVIFDYAFQSLLDGTSELKQLNLLLKAYERVGTVITSEHFLSGFKEGTVENFLLEKGFLVIENVTGEYFDRAYFKGISQRREVSRLGGIVHAKINPTYKKLPKN